MDVYAAKRTHCGLHYFRRVWVSGTGSGYDVGYPEPVGKADNCSKIAGILNCIERDGEPPFRLECFGFWYFENRKYTLRILLLGYAVNLFLLDGSSVYVGMFGHPRRSRVNFAELKQGYTLQYATGTLREEGTQLASALG